MQIDRDYIVTLAQEILTIPSPSGYTDEIIERIAQEADAFGLSHRRTKKGNLLITLPGKTDKKIGLSVHVDTLGAMVRSINQDGTLKFTSIGGPSWPTLDGEYCTIQTRANQTYTGTFLSTSPAVHVFKDANTKVRSPEEMVVRIDEVVRSKEDVKALGIEVGNYIFFDPKTTITPSGFIKSRFLDDKINVASLFGMVKFFRDTHLTPEATLELIISTYEEVGHGAAAIPELDEMIAIDMGCIGDDLSCTEYDVSICAKDSSGPYDYALTNRFAALAKAHGLNYAVDIYPYYGSDVSAALRGGNDLKGALIGPGVHASHGMERTHIDAVINTVKLLILYTTTS
ncbi:MAG: M42 family peptidase [Acholeplasmatales bacterium]|nr:MAG: M42 family peptidase [Acholeplasmatales bacterium]